MRFYRKRIPRIFFPLIFWGIIYAILPYCIGIGEKHQMLIDIVMTPVAYPREIGGILWYLFILLGIYLILPFFTSKLWTDSLYQKIYLSLWICASIVGYFKCINPFLFGVVPFCNFDLFLYFSGYVGYLLLGFIIGNKSEGLKLTKPLSAIILMGAYVICIVCIWLCSYDEPTALYIGGGFLGIFTIIMSAIMFYFLRHIRWRTSGLIYKLCCHLSKLSFAIYLCHMVIYKLFSCRLYGISTSPIMQIVIMLLTFCGAYCLAWLLYKLPYHKYTIGT